MPISRTLQQRRGLEPVRNSKIRPDFGWMEESTAAFSQGASESVTATGVAVAADIMAGLGAKLHGEPALTKEAYDEKYGDSDWVSYTAGKTQRQYDLMEDYAVRQRVRETKMKDVGMARAMAFGMAGNMIMPVDAALMFTPVGGAMKAEQATALSIRTGNTLFNAGKGMDAIMAGKSALWASTKKVAVEGARQETLENSFVYVGSKFTNREYGAADLAADTLLQFPIRTTLSIPKIAQVARVTKMNRDLLKNQVAVEHAYQTGDVQQVANVLRRYDEAMDHTITDAPDIDALLKKPNFDTDDAKVVTDFMIANKEKIFLKKLHAITPIDSRLPIEAGKQKKQLEYNAMVEKVMAGKSDELTPEQKALMEEANVDVEQAFSGLLDHFRQLEVLGAEKVPEGGSVNPETGTVRDSTGGVPIEPEAPAVRDSTVGVPIEPAPETPLELEIRLDKELIEKGDLNPRELRQTKKRIEANEAKIPEAEQFKGVSFEEVQARLDELDEEISNIFEAEKARLISEGANSDQLDISADAIEAAFAPEVTAKIKELTAEARKLEGDFRAHETAKVPTRERLNEVNQKARADDPKTRQEATENHNQKVVASEKVAETSSEAQARFDSEPIQVLRADLTARLPDHLANFLKAPFDTGDTVGDQIKRRAAITQYLEGTFGKRSAITDDYKKLTDEILDFGGYMESQRQHGHSVMKALAAGKKNPESKLSDELYPRLRALVEEHGPSAKALDEFEKVMEEERLAHAIRLVHDLAVNQKHFEMQDKSPKTLLNYFRSYLDGTVRNEGRKKGEKRKALRIGASVDDSISAQIAGDQRVLHEVLHRTGLYDLFIGAPAGKYQDALKLRKLSQVQHDVAAELYGKDLVPASNAFVRDLMEATRTGKIPKQWEGNADFKAVWEAYRKTPLSQMGQLNKGGANIHMREGHAGISQRWDEATMKKRGYDAWKKDMVDNIDWEATRKAHGGVLHAELKDPVAEARRKELGLSKEPTKWVKFDEEAFLKGWWTEMGRPTPDIEHASMDIARSFSKGRKVILKPASEADMMIKYSGHDTLGRLYIDQVRYRSEMIAVQRTVGNQPIPNFRAAYERMGLSEGVNNTTDGFLKDDRHARQIKAMDNTLRFITGALDNPVDKNLSEKGRMFRQLSNILFLPQAGISALNDIPAITATLKYQGVNLGEMELSFWDSYRKGNLRNFRGDDEAMRQYFQAQGAGMDAFLNSASQRFSLSSHNYGSTGDLLTAGNEAMFNLNYLNGITAAGQEAYMDMLTVAMARQATSAKGFEPQLRQNLKDFGFTDGEIDGLGAHASVAPDGELRLGSSDIENPDLSRKLREYQIHYMNNAVLIPDAGTNAALRMGTQDGTWLGVGARSISQYMSYPMATTNMHMRRFLNGYDGTYEWNSRSRMMIHMSSWMGSAIGMAYVSSVLKDLGKGREPMHLNNMTAASWGNLVNQSGILGIIDPLLGTAEGNIPVAPLVKMPFKLAGADSPADLVAKASPFYGGNIPAVGAFIKAGVGTAFGDFLPVYMELNQGYDFVERKYDKGQWLKPLQSYD